jgi:hypothetical protein
VFPIKQAFFLQFDEENWSVAYAKSKWVFHVWDFMFHVYLISINFQENIVFVPCQELYLILSNGLGYFVGQERGKSSSISGADDQRMCDMFSTEFHYIFGSDDEESGIGPAKDKALDVFDGQVLRKS